MTYAARVTLALASPSEKAEAETFKGILKTQALPIALPGRTVYFANALPSAECAGMRWAAATVSQEA